MTFTNFPAKFGKYILLDRLAAGGMAEVFRAKVTGVEGFERLVAIKCMLPNMAADEHFTGMFVDEARLAAQVGHTNVVQIYELGREHERLYIAMELIMGRDLRHILKTAEQKNIKLPPAFAAYVATKTAEGLDFAHRKVGADGKPLGLVHRDVSPQNILVSYDGDVKVVDFGIAKASNEARGTQTQVGILKGKFAYMAPEQVTGQSLDHRADIFALGSVLYEMVAGHRLFQGDSDLTVLEHVREAILPDFTVDLPPEAQRLVPVLHRALALSLNDRFAWAAEMAEALEPLLIEEQTIFGAKRAAALMRSLFADEVTTLASDLKRFADVTAADCVNAAVESTDVTKAPGAGRRMVFESTFAASNVGRSLRDDGGHVDRTGEIVRPVSLSHASQSSAPRLQVRRDGSGLVAAGAPRPPRTEGKRAPYFMPEGQTDAAGSDKRDTGAARASRPASRVQAGTAPPLSSQQSAAVRRVPTGERSATQVAPRVKDTRDVMRQMRNAALVTLGVCGALVLIVTLSSKAPWQMVADDADIGAIHPVAALTRTAHALRNSAFVDRWLFGGTRAEVPMGSDNALPPVADADLEAGRQATVESAVPPEPNAAGVNEGFLRISVSNAQKARIYIDGRDMGFAPLPPVQLPIGTHIVRVTHILPSGKQRSRQEQIEVTTDDSQEDPASVDIGF